MIQLLYLVLCAEGLVAFLLVVKIGPLRELVIKGLDQVKMRKGTVLTIAGTFAAILLSNFFSIVKIQNKGAKLGTMSPMDQVLWRTNLLEASLMAGVSKKEIERLEKEKLELKEKAEKTGEEIKVMRKEISNLTETLNKLKMESTEKDKKIETAEAHVAALQKQAADLLLEYDRLLEDNQNLQNQALGYQS